MSAEWGMSRRQFGYSAVLSATALAGCLSDDGDESTQDELSESIDVWGWDIAAKALEITASEFESTRDVTVSATEFERPAMKDELETALQAGEGAPAVAMLESIDAPETVASVGGARDLSDRIDAAGLREQFTDGAWDAVDVEGGTYAVPWDIGPVVMYYRRSVYEEYGLDPDGIDTWAEFVEAGEKLPDDVALLNLPADDLNGQWRTLCRQQGMQPITADGDINIASEQSYQAAKLLNNLHEAGLTTRYAEFTDEWASAYENGEIASLLSASWMVGTMQTEMSATAGDWGVFRLPAFEPGGLRASNWGGSNLMIPEQVSEETAEKAWEYITWTVANEEMQVLMFKQFGLFPTLETAYDDPVFEEESAFFGGQRVRQIFTAVAEEIPGWQFSIATPAISEAIEDTFEQMFDGEYTPREAVDRAAELVAEETGRDVAD